MNLAQTAAPPGRVLVAMGDLIEDVRVRPAGEVRPATDTPSRIERRLGGSAAEVAAAAAVDGTPAAFIGNVGVDTAGDRLVADLTAAGVTAHVTRSGRTGTVVAILDSNGERTMLTDRGSAAELPAVEPNWLSDAAILHLPAYSLLDGPLARSSHEAAKAVRAGGGLVSVDAASVGTITDYGTVAFLRLLAELAPDILLANRAEADLLAGETDIGDLGKIVAVKQGPDPALLYHSDGPTEVPVPEALALADSTGAGDAFAAGFLGGLMRDEGPAAAALRGHEVAARTLGQR